MIVILFSLLHFVFSPRTLRSQGSSAFVRRDLEQLLPLLEIVGADHAVDGAGPTIGTKGDVRELRVGVDRRRARNAFSVEALLKRHTHLILEIHAIAARVALVERFDIEPSSDFSAK